MFKVIWCLLFLLSSNLVLSELMKNGERCQDKNICKDVNLCPTALKNIEMKIFPPICGFHGKNVSVCCPGTETDASQEIEKKNNLHNVSGSGIVFSTHSNSHKALKMCNRYTLEACGGILMKPSLTESNQENYLTEEVVQTPEKYPFVGQIGYGDFPDVIWQCEGSLISDQYVLTAASCVSTEMGDANWVRFGELNVQATGKKDQDYEIIERIIHPDYSPTLIQNNIALLRVSQPVQLSHSVRPICLYTESNLDSFNLTSIGHQTKECDNSNCTEINDDMQTMIATISQTVPCDQFFSFDEQFENGNPDNYFCTSNLETRRAFCRDDAGQPIVFLNSNAGCPLIYSQVGVLSKISRQNFECDFTQRSSMYTKVTEYIPWIESIVWPY